MRGLSIAFLFILLFSSCGESYVTVGTEVKVPEKGKMKDCFLRPHVADLNTWCRFKDSIFLPKTFDSKIYNKINVFGLLGTSPGEAYDMDSLVITVKQKVSWI
jgi:hypothetical protein